MAKIILQIITPERTIYDGVVDRLSVTTTEGEITVLPGHIPLVSHMMPGELRVTAGGAHIPMAIAGGFIEVLGPTHGSDVTRVAVLADDALRVEEMDIVAIEAARERASNALASSRAADEVSFADAAASLQKELARIRVARKYRRGASHADRS